MRWQLFIIGKSILEDLVQKDLVSGNKKIVCFYRPIHLILINTNNGTELKLNDPENYRKCNFTEMLKAVIQEFLPKLYNLLNLMLNMQRNRKGTEQQTK